MPPQPEARTLPETADAHRLAQSVRDQMESLLLRDAPRIADSFSGALRDLETRLDLAYAEVHKLERSNADMQRMYDSLQDRHQAESAKSEELKKVNHELSAQHASYVKRIDELTREHEEMKRQHDRDAIRMAKVEEFLKSFPR